MLKKAKLSKINKVVGTGWLPPMPDLRDYTENHPNMVKMIREIGIPTDEDNPIPETIDLRKWCSPIEDQGSLGSCTAHAAMGIVEYFERRAFDKHIDGSRLFVYKTTRNLMGEIGDTGAFLRNTMGALVLCGVPPEQYWPYTDKDPEFDCEPSPFVYSIADNYETVKYFCHDSTPEKTLSSVKKYLAAGIPSMFGFYGFSSFEDSDIKGGIPYPDKSEWAEWGHALDTVGFDDNKIIKNLKYNTETKGALLIRNSWSEDWGDKGYGWLPYAYILNELAWDFWSILSMEWVDTGQFGF